jgi:hypothetical protein
MALVTITGSNSYSAAKYGLTMPLEAGEAIVGGYACYVKSDGKAWLAGTAVATGTTQVAFDGFAMRDYAAGDAVTLIGVGNIVMLDGNAGLTAGKELYLSATAGVLSDAKIAGADQPVAKAVSTSAIRVLR